MIRLIDSVVGRVDARERTPLEVLTELVAVIQGEMTGPEFPLWGMMQRKEQVWETLAGQDWMREKL